MKQYSFLEEAKIIVNDDTSKIIRNAFKAGKLATGTIGALVSLVKITISHKISGLIDILKNVQTREEAERILLNIGYVKDINGLKRVTVLRINYVLSKSVVGPCLQIIKNESDEQWKNHLLQHLRLCKRSNFIIGLVLGVLSTTNIISLLK